MGVFLVYGGGCIWYLGVFFGIWERVFGIKGVNLVFVDVYLLLEGVYLKKKSVGGGGYLVFVNLFFCADLKFLQNKNHTFSFGSMGPWAGEETYSKYVKYCESIPMC